MVDLKNKLVQLEARLHRLNENGKVNDGAKRRIEREIRNIKKQLT